MISNPTGLTRARAACAQQRTETWEEFLAAVRHREGEKDRAAARAIVWCAEEHVEVVFQSHPPSPGTRFAAARRVGEQPRAPPVIPPNSAAEARGGAGVR